MPYFSASQLSTLEVCSRKRLFKNLYKLPELDVGGKFAFGTEVHSIAEKFLTTGEIQKSATGHINDLVELGIEKGHLYHYPEARIEWKFRVIYKTLEINGYIDYIEVHDNHLIITEWKTARTKKSVKGPKQIAADIQLNLYGWVAGLKWSKPKIILRRVHFIKSELKIIKHEVERTQAEIEEFRDKRIYPLIAKGWHQKKEDDWKALNAPDMPGACGMYNGCVFASICDYGEDPEEYRARVEKINRGEIKMKAADLIANLSKRKEATADASKASSEPKQSPLAVLAAMKAAKAGPTDVSSIISAAKAENPEARRAPPEVLAAVVAAASKVETPGTQGKIDWAALKGTKKAEDVKPADPAPETTIEKANRARSLEMIRNAVEYGVVTEDAANLALGKTKSEWHNASLINLIALEAEVLRLIDEAEKAEAAKLEAEKNAQAAVLESRMTPIEATATTSGTSGVVTVTETTDSGWVAEKLDTSPVLFIDCQPSYEALRVTSMIAHFHDEAAKKAGQSFHSLDPFKRRDMMLEYFKERVKTLESDLVIMTGSQDEREILAVIQAHFTRTVRRVF